MIKSLYHELTHCQIADQHRLKRRISQLEKTSLAGRDYQSQLEKLRVEIHKSRKSCERRAQAIPAQMEYPDNLPVSARADEIEKLLRRNQVLVIAGDTGSGKTTQIPKICLQAGLGIRGIIGHTQPRRLAAVSVANRVAEELGCETGQGVGYQVRFNDKHSADTYLKVMTDGILLSEIQHDRFLNRYEALIIDEAHERSLNIDFMLGFLHQLLARRKDLKLIITSATIDVEKFSAHFANAPIVSVSGRTYPVETRYAPIAAKLDDTEFGDVQIEGIISAVKEIGDIDRQQQRMSGDILVFLSSEREIRETALALRKQRITDTEVLPLYARLRHSEQIKIFKPHKGRRVVLATNVAETSITVPGINYVIDTGLARISRYSLQSKVQRLPIESISQASANQRKGRCGRLANGICIRLYSEQDFESRPSFTDPEIKRTNLASVILRMKFLRLGEVDAFPFLEPPEQKAINEGFKLLFELNALTQRRELTDIGRKMAVMQVDPKYARMVVAANAECCLRELLIIVSALSVQDPRELGGDNRQLAVERLGRFAHPQSDFLSFVNLWDSYEIERQNLSQSQLRKFCKTHFLSFMRMREWREVHRQLLLTCQHLGLTINKSEATYEQVHKSIISGSLNQIACRDEKKTYLGNRNRKFLLFSSSVVAAKPPKWIVTGDLIETTQTFATMAASIEPHWVEQMALHLVKREYYEPHWSKKRQEVMAYEKVYLYGLAIIEKSPVSFQKIDSDEAREIFIRDALIAGNISTRQKFFHDNRKLLQELEKHEDKIRRPDFLVGEREIYRFYNDRIPADVSSARQLDAWLNKANPQIVLSMSMDMETLLGSDSLVEKVKDFPDQVPIKHNQLAIDYVFKPGSESDGATLEVPVTILNQLTQADVDWAVPGTIREKCIALIKSLPKTMRKHFIPVSGFVDEILPQMSSADGDLLAALVSQIRQSRRLNLSRHDFSGADLPMHLRVKVRVLDEEGEQLGFGDDIELLQKGFGQNKQVQSSNTSATDPLHELEQAGLTDWSFEDFPAELQIGEDLVLLRYPTLIDEGDSVSIKLLADQSQSAQCNRAGLTRLYMLRSVQQKNMLRKQFARFVNQQALKLPANLTELAEDALLASYHAAFNIGVDMPRNRNQFERLLSEGKARLHSVGARLEKLLLAILDGRLEIGRALAQLDRNQLGYLWDDIEHQLESLITDHFLLETDQNWLEQYPRYLEAIKQRLAKAPFVGDRDRPNTDELASYWRRYSDKASQVSSIDQGELRRFRWMIEEYRVSLFAQTLGTCVPVSAKRLEKQLEKLAC